MQAVRQGNAAQAQQMFTNTMQTLQGLQTAASTRATIGTEMRAKEMHPLDIAGKRADIAGTKAATAGRVETTTGMRTERERQTRIFDDIENLLGKPINVIRAEAEAGTLGELIDRALIRRDIGAVEMEETARKEGQRLERETALAETRIVPKVARRKEAEAEAAVPIAELAGAEAQALIDAGYPKEKADISMQLLATEPNLRQAQIRALNARAVGKPDSVLQEMLGDQFGAFKLLEAKLEMAGPLIANIRQAETALKAVDNQEFDLLELFILEKRGFDFDVANIEEDEAKQKAAKKGLQDFIQVQKALLKSPLLDIDYDALARQSILSPKQKAAMAEQLRQRRQGGTLE
jgi:hypothetical protein